jgi:outer membrane cobalamin receptor
MKKNYTYYILLALLLWAPTKLQAQVADSLATGTINGIVKEEKTGDPLPFANVTYGPGLGTTTDFDGKFTMELKAGNYDLQVSSLGMKTTYKKVRLEAGQTVSLSFSMLDSINQIEITVVTGGKYKQGIGEQTVSMEILTPTFIANSNATSIDQALNKVPGVNMIGEQVNIRGGAGYSAGAGSRVMMLMDGIPLLKPDNGVIDFASLPMENIQQIEVIKGASSAAYGSSALNGIINLITSNATDETYTKLTMFYGFYENPFSGKKKDLIWWDQRPMFGGANFAHRKRFKNLDLVISGTAFQDASYLYSNNQRRLNTFVKLRYRSAKNDRLSMGVNTNISAQSGGFFFLWKGWANTPESSITDSSGLYLQQYINALEQGVNEADIPSNVKNNIPRDAYAYLPAEIGTFSSTPLSVDPWLTYFDKKQNQHSFKSRFYRTRYNNSSGESSVANQAYGEYNFHSELKRYGLNFVTGVAGFFTSVISETFGQRNATNAAVFLQVDKKFFQRLTFNVGFRAEFNQMDTLKPVLYPIVRSGINFQATEATYIRASFGQGYRYPTIAEKYVATRRSGVSVIPNPDLQPEHGWNAEIGVKQLLKITDDWKGYVDVAGFVTQYTNMIEFLLVEGVLTTQAQNYTDARISGFDMSLVGQGKVFRVPVNIMLGYTYISPIDLNYEDDPANPDGKYLTFRFKHSAKADAEATYKKITLGITGTYFSFMKNIGQFGINNVSAYRKENDKGEAVLDARIAYNITEGAKISFIVKNITNNQYTLRPAFMEAPRNYTFQVAYQF